MAYVRTNTYKCNDYEAAEQKAEDVWGVRKVDELGTYTDAKGKLRIKRRENHFDVVVWKVVKEKESNNNKGENK